MAQDKLFGRVGSFWTSRHTGEANGLVLLDECIKHTIAHRDSDALARFLSRAVAHNTNDATAVKRIIRAAFGDSIKWKADAKHPAGGKFDLGWTKDEQFALRNTYGPIVVAIDNKKSFRSLELQKTLREQEGRPAPKAKETAAIAKHVADYIIKQANLSGLNTGEIFAAVQKAIVESASKTQAMPVKVVA